MLVLVKYNDKKKFQDFIMIKTCRMIATIAQVVQRSDTMKAK